mmetsp:Transcript_55565/g.129344  ORF Transcript_55565/g.129344 Transcript_55565/m.129344 type:complete len:179 (+) Transcript_55565:50-586(+)
MALFLRSPRTPAAEAPLEDTEDSSSQEAQPSQGTACRRWPLLLLACGALLLLAATARYRADQPQAEHGKEELELVGLAEGGFAEQEAFDCSADLDSWWRSWSGDKKQWCCKHEGKGCQHIPLKWVILGGAGGVVLITMMISTVAFCRKKAPQRLTMLLKPEAKPPRGCLGCVNCFSGK